MTQKLRIIHETNPRKYFPALYELAEHGDIELVGTHRYSVCKEWLRAWLRDRTPVKERSYNALRDLMFRFQIPFVRGETIVMGFAPWDWRLLIYRALARHNHILYQTSWHDWSVDKTPRQPKPRWFKRIMQKQWHAFVKHPNVDVIAVTSVVADTVLAETGVKARVIPHAVPTVFFKAGYARSKHEPHRLKLLYVGEISEKKGINILLNLMETLQDIDVSLTVVGKGPLVNEVKAATGRVTYLGAIFDRAELAQVMADHDVLMLLSQRTGTWEELFGIVIVEAMATGCAVIASDHIGPKGIFAGTQYEGLFDEAAYIEVEAMLRKLATSPERLQTLTQTCEIAQAYSTETVRQHWFAEIKLK